LAHALQSIGMGQHRARKTGLPLGIGQQQGGEVFDIEVTQEGIVFLHIHPDKPRLRHVCRQAIKQRLVFAASATPLCAQAVHP
jgi:hypothetical protein